MTKLKALITTLILSTSAAAFAAPAPRQIVPSQPVATWQHQHRVRWTTLASSAKINGTREIIRVGAQAGRFDQLKLETISGKTQIKLVQINFANGGSQLVQLNTTLDRNNTVATISLKGESRAISGIVVYGSSNARGAYSILAA